LCHQRVKKTGLEHDSCSIFQARKSQLMVLAIQGQPHNEIRLLNSGPVRATSAETLQKNHMVAARRQQKG